MNGVQSSGLMNSRQIVATSTLLTTYHWGVAVLTLAYLVLFGDALMRKRRLWVPSALMAVGFGWPILSLLIASQRSDIFRTLWVTLLLMYVLNPHFKRTRVAAIAVGILFLVPVAQELRSSLVAGRRIASAQGSSRVSTMLNSEFVSASQNLPLVLVNWADTRFYGQTLWWDILITGRPTFLFPERSTESITNQFNIQFYREVFASGGGQGFTLVGEGYANFGPLGVVLWFTLVGLFVKVLYARTSKSFLNVIAYIMASSVLMIATRGDMSIIMSQCTKHIFLPLGLIALPSYLLLSRKRIRSLAPGMAGALGGLPAAVRYPRPLSPVASPSVGASVRVLRPSARSTARYEPPDLR